MRKQTQKWQKRTTYDYGNTVYLHVCTLYCRPRICTYTYVDFRYAVHKYAMNLTPVLDCVAFAVLDNLCVFQQLSSNYMFDILVLHILVRVLL
jgi:hypothetical protein